VETARDAETTFALPLIDATKARGFAVKTAIIDKGYDNEPIHTGCMDRGVVPVTALRKTPAVVRGDHKPLSCEHGEWTSRAPTSSARLRSGDALRASASLRPCGSRPTACTR
jgi:hypothetical protein